MLILAFFSSGCDSCGKFPLNNQNDAQMWNPSPEQMVVLSDADYEKLLEDIPPLEMISSETYKDKENLDVGSIAFRSEDCLSR